MKLANALDVRIDGFSSGAEKTAGTTGRACTM